MKPDAYSELQNFVHLRAWSGFFSEGEILDRALEGLADGVFSEQPVDPDKDRVKRMVQEEFQRKHEAEQNWTETDCDRLSKVFAALTNKGILSIENCGFSNSEGWSIAQKLWQRKQELRGACFYHEQDLEAAVAGRLFISFGSKSKLEKDALPIGREVVSELESYGLTSNWSGRFQDRIVVSINWHRRYAPAEIPEWDIPDDEM